MDATSTAPQLTRRTFYAGLIYGLWGLITAALGVPALVYLFTPARRGRKDEWSEAGDIARLATGIPVELTFDRTRVDGWKVIQEKRTAWVLKTAENAVVAFGPQCTHLGCAYHWDDSKRQFQCPCHASAFAPDGRVLSGPAPRPLDRFETRVEGHKLLLGALRQ